MKKSNRAEKEGTVEIVGRNIVLYNDAEAYPIALSDCSYEHRVEEWVAHLSAKPWAAPHMVREFERLARAHHGLPPASGA